MIYLRKDFTKQHRAQIMFLKQNFDKNVNFDNEVNKM